MLAPQRGQTRLRIAEIKLGLVLITANEAIMYLPVGAVLHRRVHRTLSGGRQELFGQGARWLRVAASRFGFKRNSNRVAKMLCTERRLHLTAKDRMEVRVQRRRVL